MRQHMQICGRYMGITKKIQVSNGVCARVCAFKKLFSNPPWPLGCERGIQVKITVWEQAIVRECATNLSKFGVCWHCFVKWISSFLSLLLHIVLHITTFTWCFHVISSCEFRLHSSTDRQSNGTYCFWFILLQTGLLTTFRPWQWYESTPQSRFRWTTSHVNI